MPKKTTDSPLFRYGKSYPISNFASKQIAIKKHIGHVVLNVLPRYTHLLKYRSTGILLILKNRLLIITSMRLMRHAHLNK